MTTSKKMGIFMDHSEAHLMEFSQIESTTKTIDSKFTHQDKEESIQKGESLMHNKQNHRESEYYKKIAEAIKNYDEVILFGPTEAKVELFNILADDHHFSKIKIEVKNSDKLTENQQHAFVNEYFSKK